MNHIFSPSCRKSECKHDLCVILQKVKVVHFLALRLIGDLPKVEPGCHSKSAGIGSSCGGLAVVLTDKCWIGSLHTVYFGMKEFAELQNAGCSRKFQNKNAIITESENKFDML